MTLEQEWMKSQGRALARERPRRLGVGDVVARAAAVLILLFIFAFSVWALTRVQFAELFLFAAMILAIVFMASRVRELNTAVASARRDVEALREELARRHDPDEAHAPSSESPPKDDGP